MYDTIDKNELEYLYLPKNTILNNEYIIDNILAERSEYSIVYKAVSLKNNQEKTIKEFFPKKLVLRDLDKKKLICTKNSLKDSFEDAKHNFSNEAAIIKSLDNKNIVKYNDYFEENNTAYLVLDYCEGITLDKYIENTKNLNLEDFTKNIFFPILDAVNDIHKKKYIHGDIKPANIIIDNNNSPVLIDFGSSIKFDEQQEKKNIFITPSFSPLELYCDKAKQGIYSDIYSLAALVYYCFTGEKPIEVTKRLHEDTLYHLNFIGKKNPLLISNRLNKKIMKNLALDYKHRYKNINKMKFEFKKELVFLKIKKRYLKI